MGNSPGCCSDHPETGASALRLMNPTAHQPDQSLSMMRHTLIFSILILATVVLSADEPAKRTMFPRETVPAVTRSGQRILHEDDFSTDTLGQFWGTLNVGATISDGTLKATRDDTGKGKYKVKVEPYRNAEFSFRFRFEGAERFLFGTDDLSITDTVHGGHLFNCTVTTQTISFTDCLTGIYNPEHYPKFKKAKDERKAGGRKKLPAELQAIQDATTKVVPCKIEQNRWYHFKITLKDDLLSVALDGSKIGSYRSPGFAHPRKDTYRFIMGGTLELDDVKVIALD